MIMMGFGTFFHVGIGKALHHFWDGISVNEIGSPIYSADNFYYAFISLPISLAVAIVGFSFLAYVEKRSKKVSA